MLPVGRELLDAFADALIVVTPAGEILSWSKGAEMVFGYRAEEAVGRAFVELLVEPSHREEEQRRLLSAADGEGGTYEAERRTRTGKRVFVDVSVRRFVHEGAAHLAISQKDVTHLKYRREAAVLEAKFRGLLDAAPDAMIMVNADGRIVLLNTSAQRLFGYTRDELLGREVEVLIPSRFTDVHEHHRARYFHDPRARPMGEDLDLYARTKDGTEFPAEVSLSPVTTEDGVFTTAAVRNVSERKRTEMALKVAYRELEAFSYSVAHDLRAPLRGMSGFARVLLDDYQDRLEPDAVECLNEIHSNAIRMGELIDALLALSSVVRSQLLPEPVDLSALAREIVGRLRARAPERAAEVKIEDGLWALLDPALARTLLENLLDNAWKFTAPCATTRIEVGATPGNQGTAFFVRDNGAGFDMAYASRLFGPFQRMHAASEFPGTGIGLATVSRIIQRHGGRVWAESAPGKGATFWFSLEERVEAKPR